VPRTQRDTVTSTHIFFIAPSRSSGTESIMNEAPWELKELELPKEQKASRTNRRPRRMHTITQPTRLHQPLHRRHLIRHRSRRRPDLSQSIVSHALSLSNSDLIQTPINRPVLSIRKSQKHDRKKHDHSSKSHND